MSDNFHRCDESPDYVTVIIEDRCLKFVDEYKFEINYCPYCGKSEEDLV